MKKLVILVALGLLNFNVFAVEIPKDTSNRLLRDKSFLALPVVFRLPETRFGGGVAASGTFSFAKDSSWAKPSLLSFSATYTQNKQVLLVLPFSIFAKNNTYFINSESGWYRYNYYYFGIGEERHKSEIYDVDYPNIDLSFAKLINQSTYVGIRYYFNQYKITNYDQTGELMKNSIPGSQGSRTSMVGIQVIKDTRDLVFYPSKGIFAKVNVGPSLKIIGADRNFMNFNMDISEYRSISKKTILASNQFISANLGDVPFNQMSLLGGAKRMRGLYYAFFRDTNALLFQEELRRELGKIFGVVAFGSVGFLGNEKDLIRFNKPKFAYGLGLRVATKKHLNLRVDYGLSPYQKPNLYITIGEAF